MFAASKSPYLGAVVRESNRLTCPANLAPMRRITQEVEIHGHVLPAGSMVGFDQASKSIDPEFVNDAFSFRPERFLPNAVQARKGTKSEFLDARTRFQ
jgi:cytochrome P450